MAEDKNLEQNHEEGTGEDQEQEREQEQGSEQGSDDEDVKDKHGQPGINREKYQRDIKERDEKIAELEARIAAEAETKEGREKLEADIKSLKAEMADKDTTHSLEMAGCVNVKAAKAVLADYEGDVEKLKSECPYLFGSKQKQGGSTGFPPAGSASASDERKKAARKAAGLE